MSAGSLKQRVQISLKDSDIYMEQLIESCPSTDSKRFKVSKMPDLLNRIRCFSLFSNLLSSLAYYYFPHVLMNIFMTYGMPCLIKLLLNSKTQWSKLWLRISQPDFFPLAFLSKRVFSRASRVKLTCGKILSLWFKSLPPIFWMMPMKSLWSVLLMGFRVLMLPFFWE